MTNDKTLIFWDWNGTIVNDVWLFVKILNVFLKNVSQPPISIDMYRDLFCFPIEDFYKKINLYHNQNSFEKITKQFISIYRKHIFEPKLVRGILDVVDYNSTEQTSHVVLSAQNSVDLNNSINHYGLPLVFKSVYGVDNVVARGKINLAKKMVNKHRVSKVLVIGDTSLDYRVAEAIGASCFLVSWGHYSQDRLCRLPVPVFSSVLQLKKSISSFISH